MPGLRTTIHRARATRVLVLAALLAGLVPGTALAETPSNAAFQRTWERTDKPVADGSAARTWMWGPEAFTPELSEEYAEGAGGHRAVQYFDKSRMEITTDASVAPGEVWYITNGLLVLELVSGRMQVDDATFEDRAPAWINVAGDGDDPLGPTYATFAGLLDTPPHVEGATISARLNRYGVIGDDPDLSRYGVTAGYRVMQPGIDHRVASVFWEFMTSAGTVWEDGASSYGALFVNPFYATGYPISEAFWSNISVAGERVDVLIQCFERRCLTYTPGNPVGWQVEAGNVGRHYYRWRYDDWPGHPPAAGDLLYSSDLSGYATFNTAAGNGAWLDGRYIINDHDDPATLSAQLLVYMTADDYPEPFADQRTTLDVRIASGGKEVFACLVALYERDATGSRRYVLCIDGYNTVSAAWESFDSAGRFLDYESLLEFSATDALLSSSDWTRLELVTVGDAFWFVVNGDLVGTARHAGQTSGWAGFYLVNDAAGTASAEFRDLAIYAISD